MSSPCRPGWFYLRELPLLRAVWSARPTWPLLMIDGYVGLDSDGPPGRLRPREFGVPVIGVARSAFRTATHLISVLRGTSARPLYVTASGMPRADAADLVRHVAGQHRLPKRPCAAGILACTGPPHPPRR